MRKTKEDAEITKKNILEAALKVFVDKTYDKATLNQIANEARVTRGAIYWHFENKFDILKSLSLQKGDSFFKEVLNHIAEEKSPIKRIIKMFNDFFDLLLFDEKFMLYRKLLEFKLSDSEEIKEITKTETLLIQKFKEIMITVVEEGKEKGEIRKDIDTEFMAVSFLNWSMGLQRIWMQFTDLYDIKKNKQLILENIEKLIKV